MKIRKSKRLAQTNRSHPSSKPGSNGGPPAKGLTIGGSLVSEPGTFELLLSSCMVVWLRATPEEHMQRVVAQGDMRPMANNRDAMADLRRILAERETLYCKADIKFETSGLSPEESVEPLLQALRDAPVRELEPTFVSGQS